MLKKLFLFLLIGRVNDSFSSENDLTKTKITKNKYLEFYHHGLRTNPNVIRSLKNNKARHLKDYRKARANASTCKEIGAAFGIISGFVAYGAFLTWMAMGKSQI